MLSMVDVSVELQGAGLMAPTALKIEGSLVHKLSATTLQASKPSGPLDAHAYSAPHSASYTGLRLCHALKPCAPL